MSVRIARPTRTTFRFGMPSSLGPTRNELFPALGDLFGSALGIPVEVSTAESYDVLAKDLLSGKLDAAWAPPFVCARVEAMGVRILARGIRRGSSSYRAALVARAGANLSLTTLAGRTALWVDPNSVAGYLLPLAHLKANRLDPARLFFSQEFAGAYQAALEGVREGKADVTSIFAPAASPGLPDDTGIDQVLPGRAADFSVVSFTDEAPNDGVAVSVSTSEQLASVLQTALLSLQDSAEGSALLGEAFHAERFEPAPRMGYRALYRVALASL